MSLSDYEDFVYGACMPDMDDPVGHWQRFSAWQQQIVDWLKVNFSNPYESCLSKS